MPAPVFWWPGVQSSTLLILQKQSLRFEVEHVIVELHFQLVIAVGDAQLGNPAANYFIETEQGGLKVVTAPCKHVKRNWVGKGRIETGLPSSVRKSRIESVATYVMRRALATARAGMPSCPKRIRRLNVRFSSLGEIHVCVPWPRPAV